MRIQFCCPACRQPVSADSRHIGKTIPCPGCKEDLTVPAESSHEGSGLPEADAAEMLPRLTQTGDGQWVAAPSSCQEDADLVPMSSGARHRLRGVVLASVLLALVAGLGAVIACAFPGKDLSSRQPQMEPADRLNGEAEAFALAQPDKLQDDDDDFLPDVCPGLESSEAPATQTAPAGRKPAGPPSIEAAQDAASQASGPHGDNRSNKEAAKKGITSPEKNETDQPALPPVANPAVPAAKLQPQAPEKKTVSSVRERYASKRRSRLTDEELRQQLLLPPEVDLDAAPGTTKRIIYLSGKSANSGADIIPQLTRQRPDLLGLPLHQGHLARVGREEALDLTVLSQRLRLQIQTSMPANAGSVVDPRPDPEILRQRLLNSPLREVWLQPQAIATLRQLLMSEHRNVRLVLVDVLSKIDGRLASMALAERAVFDLDADVRLAALVALKLRPSTEYVSALIAGLRYPWPAFADHAAEALVALDLRDAVPKLIALLDVRDLADPYPVDHGKTRRAMVPELVRINHLRNCLLCHAYSSSPTDPVRGLVPHAEHLVPLPSSVTLPTKGWGGGGSGSTPKVLTQTFVRADINFLRQDFSVVQPVPKHGRLWPADQRYDYLIRLRPLTARDLASWQDKVKDYRPAEPQRESLLYALRELSTENPGPAAEDWKRLYSTITGRRHDKPLEPSAQVLHLRDCLVEGSGLQQTERLSAFKDKNGPAYDTALALAIPQLKAELQKTARTILVDRLYCLPLKTLGQKLADPDLEVRRAAVNVCRQRKLKVLVPELIALLDDGNQDLARQVHDLLQQFAARDYGPPRGADRQRRLEAMTAWRDWWEEQTEKQAAQKRPGS